MVCGHAQPQKILPKTTVNRTMNKMNINIPNPNMKKSWAQNTTLKRMKRPLGMLNKNKGSPCHLMNGMVKKTSK